MENRIKWNSLEELQQPQQFSGSVFAERKGTIIFSESYGYRNFPDRMKNRTDTRFSIASGSKIFTSIAICQLVEAGRLSFDTRLLDCLEIEFPHFDKEITIHHLLTHTSGVPDYFDEDEMDDYEALWHELPMYRARSPKNFLPLFQNGQMDYAPGGDFKYNNAGYILLGLVIEQINKQGFTDYVTENIFKKAGMTGSGYFPSDELPENVATGYMEQPDGTMKSNIFSLPAAGGPDGGAYITAPDMGKFWDALKNGKLLAEDMTRILLTPRENVDDDIYHGYGGYMQVDGKKTVKFIQMGYDPGVNYRSVHYPDQELTLVVCSNKEDGAYEMLKEIESMMTVE